MAVLERNLNTVFINSVIYIDNSALLANLESDVLNPFALIGGGGVRVCGFALFLVPFCGTFYLNLRYCGYHNL